MKTFEEFFHSHYERLLRTMYLTTGDRHEAEDLAQDAMARVYERWDRIRNLEDPRGYAYRTALNLRRSRLRRLTVASRKALRIREDEEPSHDIEQRDELRRALATLPPGQRDALVLVDYLDMTDVQAGQVLAVSASAVRTRASRARAAFRDLLGEESDV